EAGRVLVTPAPSEAAKLPFWRGEGAGRTAPLGRAMLELTERFSSGGEVGDDCLLTETARQELNRFLAEQATVGLPTAHRLVVEHFTDELGDRRMAIHLPLGGRINTPLSLMLARQLRPSGFVATDDGILFRFAKNDGAP